MLVTEELQRAENLLDIRPGALHQAVALEGDAHVDAGRPRPHREGVDCDPRLVAEAVASEMADEEMARGALPGRADPVVGDAGTARGLVNGCAGKRKLTIEATLLDRIGADVAVLVGGREPHRPEVTLGDVMTLQMLRVRRHVRAGMAGRSNRTPPAEPFEQARWRVRHHKLVGAIPRPDEVQGAIDHPENGGLVNPSQLDHGVLLPIRNAARAEASPREGRTNHSAPDIRPRHAMNARAYRRIRRRHSASRRSRFGHALTRRETTGDIPACVGSPVLPSAHIGQPWPVWVGCTTCRGSPAPDPPASPPRYCARASRTRCPEGADQ